MSAVDSFRAAMRRAGLDYAGPIPADGRLRRFKAGEDHAQNSWYVLYVGPPMAGAFGCWKRGINETWCSKTRQDYSPAQWGEIQARWKQAEVERERVECIRRKQAQKIAAWIYNRAKPVLSHPYLKRKNVLPHGPIREYHDKITIPLRDSKGELHSLQFIGADGSKLFLRGGRIAGCFFTLSDNPDGSLVICEGYATGASIHEAMGYAVICAMNCGNIMAVAKAQREKYPQREIIIAGDDDRGTKGNPGLTAAVAAAKAICAKLAVPQFKDSATKPTDFNDLHQLEGLHIVKTQIEAAVIHGQADDLQAALADTRRKIRLPGPDRLLSDFGRELGEVLNDEAIFRRNNDEVVILVDGQLKALNPQTLRCWAEQFFIGYRAKTIGENTFEFNVTMTDNEARGVLSAPQFLESLRHVRRINHVQLPTLGTDGKLALLPNGFDPGTGTFTIPDVVYDLEMPTGKAVKMLNDLLREFCFADGDRSKAVAISAMVGVFASQLLPEKSLRPCFVFVGNAEGCGKSLLTQVCIVPTLGAMATGSKAADDDEIRKAILTAVREASPVIIFDNIKGKLSSATLEAFLSAPVFGGRKLGVNANITGENVSTVFVTGNGMTCSPDMRRRSLFVELHLGVERAEDRVFSRLLDLPTLLNERPRILAALWALVKHWDMQGRPAPSRSHSAFPSWAAIIGGIVEAAGFACPLATANVSAAADADGEAMRRLVQAMADKTEPLTFGEVITLAHDQGLFEILIGSDDAELDRRGKAAFAKLLTRYTSRLVLDRRFMVDGQGRSRRYRVEPCHGDMVCHGVSDDRTSLYTHEEHPE